MELMDEPILAKLLNYQIPHCFSLIFSFDNSNVIIDASDTGTGKTYCSLAICKQLQLQPIIICPKSVIVNWLNVCKYFEIEPTIITNYEKVINGSYAKNDTNIFPFVFYNNSSETFEWNLSPNQIIILDEAHRCKNNNTLHSKLLLSLYGIENKVIVLSATLADKIKLFKNFGYLLKFYKEPNMFIRWIKKEAKDGDIAITLNKKLFPHYGGRMRIKDLGDMFPKNTISAKCYTMNNADKIAEQYMIIEKYYQELKNKTIEATQLLPKIIRARQAIELLKIPTFINQINCNIIDGKSIVVFLNFNQTLQTIAKELAIDCLVHGKQTTEERNRAIDDFQTNKQQIILCNIRAGGVGISLHDLYGSHQRVSIISPTWSAQDFIQCLGRIHRAGAKTDAIQHIIFCDGTIEEFICSTLKNKLENLSKLNDGDFDTYIITGINDNESDSEHNTDTDSEEVLQLLGDSSIKTTHKFNPIDKKK
jgi:superfamily II DNA or RNA helicase